MTHNRARRTLFAQLAAATALLVVGTALVAAPAQAATDLRSIDLSPNSGARGMAITPDGTLLLVTNEGSDTVTVIDTASNSPIQTIGVCDTPTAVAVTPDGTQAYVVCFNGGNLDVIDIATLAVTGGPISVSGLPTDVVFTHDGATAYVAGYSTGSIHIIDVGTATVTDSVTGLSEPQDLSISSDDSTLWIVGGSAVLHMDTATQTLSTPVAAPGTPQLRYGTLSPDGTQLAAGGDGTTDIFILDTSDDTFGAPIAVGQNGYAFTYSNDGSRLYVGLGDNDIAEIDTATNANLGNITTGTESWFITMSPSGDFGYVSSNGENKVTIIGDPVRRVAGTDRYDTAIKVSQQAFPATADVVLVATGLNYPDALAAGPAAAALGGPLLLTDPDSLPTSVRDEIVRLNPANIIVVGGTGAVSASVYAALTPLAPSIERWAGTDRYDTSREIAKKAFLPGGASDVFIATGLNFPDALSAGAVGAGFGNPVLLLDGSASTVDQGTLDVLGDLGAVNVLIAGGTGVVSSGIETQLIGEVTSVQRLPGTSRYDTSWEIVNSANYPSTVDRALIATGVNYPDALAGSAWAGKVQAPLFIVPGTCVPQPMIDKIVSLGVIQVTLIGGTGVLTQSVFDLTAC